jgi:DNA-binding XRE family transcriptional regulator
MNPKTVVKLRHFMELHGIEQAKMAEMVGVTQGYISQICSGYLPNLRIAMKIAVVLGRPVEDIWIFGAEDE